MIKTENCFIVNIIKVVLNTAICSYASKLDLSTNSMQIYSMEYFASVLWTYIIASHVNLKAMSSGTL